MKGKLYIVATPIGNLEDITLRAINVLKEVDFIIAEDTRHSLKLLNHLEISKPLISYHRHNEENKTEDILNKIEEGKNIALISDAGTPVISDPGEFIVKEAIEREIEVIPIPGACAIITALMAAGVNTRNFTFYGFLSLNKKIRTKELEQIKDNNNTVILYEAPHKIKNTMQDLENYVDDRKIVIARELTKIHEEFIRGTIDEIKDKLQNPKGEYVIIIDKNENINENEENKLRELSIEEHYKYYEKMGLEKKEIIKKIAKDRQVAKNEIYKQFIN
ncbi:MAG: 16S rRNA (cytidine(1402)-2'-O)-methyltransferase [Clostridia bacterium]|jgi:16S rRNA (cytidine1402-2'-O)-methyltransferase|nr:16S rRNA (cytidine(1402)-2'-O)-methyltransferase [Clostridium sp.]HJJ11964.1 16S rRNA (cytidine(1402)-2'-O)-methyltransferase [Clostridiaceae bacterium]